MPTELSGQMNRVFRYETLFLNFCSAEEFMLEKSLRPWNKSVQLDLQLTSVPHTKQKVTASLTLFIPKTDVFFGTLGSILFNWALYCIIVGILLRIITPYTATY